MKYTSSMRVGIAVLVASFFLLYMASAKSFSDEEDLQASWQCEPTGSYADYQAVVAYARHFAATQGVAYLRNIIQSEGYVVPRELQAGQGFFESELAFLDRYGDKPDYDVLQTVRQSECKKTSFALNGSGRIPHMSKLRRVRELRAMSADFYDQHYAELSHAAHTYNVPLSLVVSIFGMETVLGQVKLRHSVVHTNLTLLYFYGNEGRDEKFNPLTELMFALWMKRMGHIKSEEMFKGSYAGALGIPQFLPSSVFKFGRDGDGDGVVDLYGSLTDSVASVANYLEAHGYDYRENWCEKVELSKKDLSRIRQDKQHFQWGYSVDLVHTKQGWQNYFKQKSSSSTTVPSLSTSQEKFYRLLVVRDARKGRYEGCLVSDNLRAVWNYNNSIIGYAAPVLLLSNEIQKHSKIGVDEVVRINDALIARLANIFTPQTEENPENL